MTRICPNCHKVLEHETRYCSERCAREVRRQRHRILFVATFGGLMIALAIHSAPVRKFRPEPRLPPSKAELQRRAVDDSCPICTGQGKVDCKVCIAGKIFYMGTSAACNRCKGDGWMICPACAGAGDLDAAMRLTSFPKTRVKSDLEAQGFIRE